MAPQRQANRKPMASQLGSPSGFWKSCAGAARRSPMSPLRPIGGNILRHPVQDGVILLRTVSIASGQRAEYFWIRKRLLAVALKIVDGSLQVGSSQAGRDLGNGELPYLADGTMVHDERFDAIPEGELRIVRRVDSQRIRPVLLDRGAKE